MKLIISAILAALVSMSASAQALQISPEVYDDARKLTEIANIYGKHGLIDKMFEFSELADKAKQRAEIEMMTGLVDGDIDRAMAANKRSGSTLYAVRPIKLRPNNPNDHGWKVQYEGSGEVLINAKDALDMMNMVAQYGGIYNPYTEEREKREAAEERQAAVEERRLRMQLMDEQRQALRDQKRMMESQQIRNELQTLEMLGPQQGQGLNYRGY